MGRCLGITLTRHNFISHNPLTLLILLLAPAAIRPCERRFLKFVNVKSNDLENLRMFADLLKKTEVLLKDIQCYGSLNSLEPMITLVNKFPCDMRRAWVRESVAIKNQTNRIASFRDLTSFVMNKSMEANSLYGRRILASANKPNRNIKAAQFFSSNSVSADFPLSSTLVSSHSLASSNLCFFCDSLNHLLLNCPKFLIAPVENRSKFVNSKKLCFKCLSSRHRTFQCKKQGTCSVKGCTGTFHHTLLHGDKKVSEITNSSNDSSTDQKTVCTAGTFTNVDANSLNSHSSEDVFLCVVPVRVRHDIAEVHNYSYVSGSGFNPHLLRHQVNQCVKCVWRK